MPLYALGDKSVPEKQTENETKLSQKADESGRVISTPATNNAHAQHSAKGKVKSSAMKSIEAEAETIGLPYLKARETITIENIGAKFSGEWRITKIRHNISSSGYLCTLTLAKNDHSSAGNTKKKNANSAPKTSANTKNNSAKPVNEVPKNSATNKPKTVKVDLNTGQVIQNGK